MRDGSQDSSHDRNLIVSELSCSVTQKTIFKGLEYVSSSSMNWDTVLGHNCECYLPSGVSQSLDPVDYRTSWCAAAFVICHTHIHSLLWTPRCARISSLYCKYLVYLSCIEEVSVHLSLPPMKELGRKAFHDSSKCTEHMKKQWHQNENQLTSSFGSFSGHAVRNLVLEWFTHLSCPTFKIFNKY